MGGIDLMADVRLVVLDLEPSRFQLPAGSVTEIDTDNRVGSTMGDESVGVAPVLEVGLPALEPPGRSR